MLQQVSVFLENSQGTLSDMALTIAKAEINMDFLAVADTAEFGIVRILCNSPTRAIEALRSEGYVARLTPVIAVELNDEVGTLAQLFESAEKSAVNISYAYCFVDPASRRAVGILKVTDSTFEEVLKEQGYTLI